jgi:hypothetical protein
MPPAGLGPGTAFLDQPFAARRLAEKLRAVRDA